MKKISIAITLIACCMFNSCGKKTDAAQGPKKMFEIINTKEPIYYGNGVYHFKDCTEREFCVSMSKFMSDSTKYVQGLVSDGMGSNGYDAGYFFVIDCPERTPIKNTWGVEIIEPVYYENGFYYFDCTEMDFAISLATFLSDDTKYVQTITIDRTGSNGRHMGYSVIVDLPDL